MNRQLSSESLTRSTDSLGPTIFLQLILIPIISCSSTMRPLVRLTRPGPSCSHTRMERSQMVSTTQGVAPGMVYTFVSFRLLMLTLGPAHRSDRLCPQQGPVIRGDELLPTVLPAVLVFLAGLTSQSWPYSVVKWGSLCILFFRYFRTGYCLQ